MSPRVVVLGAGVVGLTSALELKKAHPDYDITVIGYNIPGDIDQKYTSPFAGANWQSFFGPEESQFFDVDGPTYRRLLNLAKNQPRSGIAEVTNKSCDTEWYHKTAQKDGASSLPWYKDIVDDFRLLKDDELPMGVATGFAYKGVVVSVQIYLGYLLGENLTLGNVVRRVKKLENIEEAVDYHSSGSRADLLINCAGLLAGETEGLNDSSVLYPVRGQTVHISNSTRHKISVNGFPGYPDETLYVMPRKEGGCIVGGCFQPNNTNTEEDQDMTSRILERAVKYVPELVDQSYKHNAPEIEVIRVNVGFRPFRKDGLRIEIDPQRPWIIHSYGFGGGGYQGSYGASLKVMRLVPKALAALKPHSKL